MHPQIYFDSMQFVGWSNRNKTYKFKFMQNIAKKKQITLTQGSGKELRIVRMICEFLDYYSSRFDLNRCSLSSSTVRRSNFDQQQQH